MRLNCHSLENNPELLHRLSINVYKNDVFFVRQTFMITRDYQRIDRNKKNVDSWSIGEFFCVINYTAQTL